MRLLSESSIREYARQFCTGSGKMNPNEIETFKAIDAGEDPVSWLRRRHDYKLPRPHNDLLSIVLVTNRNEVENLLVHEYMPRDPWMVERGLVPQPFTRRLGDLAAACLERGYFSVPRQDRQIQYFRDWNTRASLANVISTEEMPLIEATGTDQFEIVDGWGRLLPFAALLIRGLAFEPFQTFLASRAPSKQELNIEGNAPGNAG